MHVVREARRTGTGPAVGAGAERGGGALDWTSGKRRLPRALQPTQPGSRHHMGRGVGGGLDPLPVGAGGRVDPYGAGLGRHGGAAGGLRHGGRRGLRG